MTRDQLVTRRTLLGTLFGVATTATSIGSGHGGHDDDSTPTETPTPTPTETPTETTSETESVTPTSTTESGVATVSVPPGEVETVFENGFPVDGEVEITIQWVGSDNHLDILPDGDNAYSDPFNIRFVTDSGSIVEDVVWRPTETRSTGVFSFRARNLSKRHNVVIDNRVGFLSGLFGGSAVEVRVSVE